jgi:hypothetical protein
VRFWINGGFHVTENICSGITNKFIENSGILKILVNPWKIIGSD